MMLSIIIPVYNTKLYLSDCVRSVLKQENLDFEVILIDDGSTDGSGKLCDKLANLYSQVKVIHKVNGGLGSARNVGIEHALGEFLAFVDSDDTVAPNTFSINLPILLNSDVDFLQFPVARETINGVERVKYNETFFLHGSESMFYEWLINKRLANYAWNKIYRKSLFDSSRFPVGMYYEDRFFMCELLKNCKRIASSDLGLYLYRQRSGQITSFPDSESVLLSKIKADLNIAKHTKSYGTLLNANIERFFNCISYRQKMIDNGWPLDFQIEQDLRREFPSIQRVLRSRVPVGIKIELIKTAFWGFHSNS